MKIINKDSVSHVTIFKETQGFKVAYNCFWKHTYYGDEFFNFLWLFPIKILDKGYYRNGKKDSWYRMDEDYFDKDKNYTLLDEVYTKCHIVIFSAGKEIHTEYFDDCRELEQHVKDNYNHCTIKYGK